MATFLLPTVAITLFLFVFTPTFSVAGPIVDTDGDLVQNGREYYILPLLLGSGGLTVTKNESASNDCPLFVKPHMYTRGSPVTISSPLRILHLKTSIPVVFYFNHFITTCNKPMRWWVSSPTEEDNNSYVMVGTDGPFKPTYAFKIEEAKSGKENEYRIEFCHRMESQIFRVSEEVCKDVTILKNGLLGVKENPTSDINFAFEKATSMSTF